MHRPPKRFLFLSSCLVSIVATSVSACGSGGGATVARVKGVGTISKAMLEHWIPVEATVLYEETPKRPVPVGVVPDPPNFTSCVAYLGTIAKNGSGGQLKARCVQRYRELKILTLNTLILWDWTIGAGLQLGMRANDAEIEQQLVSTNKVLFPKQGEFEKYLTLTGQTRADMLFRAKVSLFEAKLIQRKLSMEKAMSGGQDAAQREEALARFASFLPPSRRWAAQTSCQKGYVVSACAEYKGSQAPGIPN